MILLQLRAMCLTIVLGFLATVYILPSHAQTTARDHRTKTTKKSKVKVREEAENRDAVVAPVENTKYQILYFDEADALFGKRTYLMVKPASFEYTGKMDTIHIRQKLHNGDNLVYKMKSGNTVHANVKNGRIVELVMKDSDRKKIALQNPQKNMTVYDKQKPTVECLNCKEICVAEIDESGFPVGGTVCWTQCTKVDCDSKDNNAILLPDKNKID